MKHAFLSLILFSVSASYCQPSLAFTEVVVLDSIIQTPSKDELFNRALAWVNKAYKSPATVIEVKDREAGQISLRGVIDFTKSGMFNYDRNFNGIINYSVNILVKDGRYKYEISNFSHQARTYGRFPEWTIGTIYNGAYAGTAKPEGPYKNYHQMCKDNCDATAKELITSLQATMNKPTTDNW